MEKSYIKPEASINLEARIITSHWNQAEYEIIKSALESRKVSLANGLDTSMISNCQSRIENIINHIDTFDTSDFKLNEKSLERRLKEISDETHSDVGIGSEETAIRIKYSVMDHLVILDSLRYYGSMPWMEIESVFDSEYVDRMTILTVAYSYVVIDGLVINSNRIIDLIKKNVPRYINLSLVDLKGRNITEGIGYTLLEASDSQINIAENREK